MVVPHPHATGSSQQDGDNSGPQGSNRTCPTWVSLYFSTSNTKLGPAQDASTSPDSTTTPNQAALPLRQALQQRRPQVKTVDITDKFTQACNGRSALALSPFSHTNVLAFLGLQVHMPLHFNNTSTPLTALSFTDACVQHSRLAS
jgi:hypothetical protein